MMPWFNISVTSCCTTYFNATGNLVCVWHTEEAGVWILFVTAEVQPRASPLPTNKGLNSCSSYFSWLTCPLIRLDSLISISSLVMSVIAVCFLLSTTKLWCSETKEASLVTLKGYCVSCGIHSFHYYKATIWNIVQGLCYTQMHWYPASAYSFSQSLCTY